MKILSNIRGRVNNFNLPKNKFMLPMLEAVSNSIQAIDELGLDNGVIKINVSRYNILGVDIDEDKIYGQIDGFVIEDNGVGLNERNFKSFMEADSTYKYKIGGKGIGRFTWLKAFKDVEIESCFKNVDSYCIRKFNFNLDNDDIPEDFEVTNSKNSYTIVKLLTYIDEYSKYATINTNNIVDIIVEHFFSQLLNKNFPKIILKDVDNKNNESHIDVGEYFNKYVLSNCESEKFYIDKNEFEIVHIKTIVNDNIKANKLYLSANDRIVEVKDLEKLIVDINDSFYKNTDFGYVAILKSDYLDKNVDANRTSFNIPSDDDVSGMLSKQCILKNATEKIEKYLDKYLADIRNMKIVKIKNYINESAPQYKYLLKYAMDELLKLNADIQADKLYDILGDIKRKLDKKARKDFDKFYKELDNKKIDQAEYRDNLKRNMEKITDLNSSILAEYVAHRKVILEVLEKTLTKKSEEIYYLEEEVHNIIYPMRSDSDSQTYENHNLWLIDEKLSYCEYIASDIPFNNNPKEPRPDILMLDNTIRMVSDSKNEGSPFENIVMFELKRPMRDNYKTEDMPTRQMIRYVSRLKENNVKDRNGRPIMVDSKTRYFLYAVCDITPTLKELILLDNFKETMDKMGYYQYHEAFNAYLEIISYDKLIKDAKKRNRVFFNKLGI